jgi:type V secretory pathway adhesin AidA
MTYSEFNDFISSCGTRRTEAKNGEVALTKTNAIKALTLLEGTNVAVLGGDVYELESDGYFRPTHDNWYLNKDDTPSLEFAARSREKAQAYIRNYNETEGLNYRYVFVVDI